LQIPTNNRNKNLLGGLPPLIYIESKEVRVTHGTISGALSKSEFKTLLKCIQRLASLEDVFQNWERLGTTTLTFKS
jgi:hypothetical protein